MLVLALSVTAIMANSRGAPDQACGNGLIPGHTSPTNMATGEVPFNVSTSNIGSSYTPDTTYTSECVLIRFVILMLLLAYAVTLNYSYI